jgi:hypothetical protein
MRSMLGVATPMLSLPYDETFIQPTSSPKITRMCGVLAWADAPLGVAARSSTRATRHLGPVVMSVPLRDGRKHSSLDRAASQGSDLVAGEIGRTNHPEG